MEICKLNGNAVGKHKINVPNKNTQKQCKQTKLMKLITLERFDKKLRECVKELLNNIHKKYHYNSYIVF